MISLGFLLLGEYGHICASDDHCHDFGLVFLQGIIPWAVSLPDTMESVICIQHGVCVKSRPLEILGSYQPASLKQILLYLHCCHVDVI